MNDRDELLQERLAQLAAGEPLEELLDGLSADEAESLKLAATMGAVRFEQDETTVAAQRDRLLDTARQQLPTATPARAAFSLWTRLQSWISQRPAYRGAAVAIAGLLIIVLLGSVWLNRPQSGGPASDESLASSMTTPESIQEIEQPSEDPATADAGSSEAKETTSQTAEVAADDSVYQVYVPVANQALRPAADKAILSRPRGLVEVASIDGDWLPVTRDMLVQAGHFVRTGRLSSASLTFYDGSQTRLGPDSQVSIDQLDAQRPQDGFRTVVLTQQFGETNHSVQFRNDAGSLYQVKTPTGSGIARGTQFRVRVSEDAQASYTVSEGKVDVSNASRTVSVLAGQQTSFAQDEAPQDPEFWVSGAGFVTQIGATEWMIGGQAFDTTNTKFEGSPEVGDFVHVDGHLEGGNPVADTITLLWTSPENTFTLTGIVESMGDTWLVAGQNISVTLETVQDPGISVNAMVRVSGTIEQPGGELIAETIELLDSIEEMPFEFVGVVEAVGPNWVVSGIMLQEAAVAEIEPGILVGDIVKAEGFIVDGDWIVHEIKLLEKDEATFEFTGEVIHNGAPDWTDWIVADISFDVDAFTQIDEGIMVGDIVRVRGIIQDDGTWLARSIEKLDDSLLEIVFVGIVDDIPGDPDDPWIISDIPIFTDGAVIDPDIIVGSLVRVTALIQVDNTWLATRIELLSDEVPLGCFTVTAVITGLNEDTVFLSNGQTVLLNGVVVEGELTVGSVVAIVGCANPDNTIEIISITVVYTPVQLPPPDDDDIDDDDGDDGRQEVRVSICHKPGTPAEKTMSLPQSALGGHLGHGDYKGPCP